MNPFFTIITPTLQRDSLVRCCESMDAQTYGDWQHIVMVDDEHKNRDLCIRIKQNDETGRRWVHDCGMRHANYGNTCRHEAWAGALGEWIWYVDDDNYIYDHETLSSIAAELSVLPEDIKFCIFPIMRHGRRFFNDPPGLCMTDTLNFIVRRKVGRWPDIEAREADGHFIESLKKEYRYASFPNHKPIGVMEYSSNGV